MTAIILLAALACPPGQGEWADECWPCTLLDDYHQTTPLPKSCPALVPGVLYTVEADAATAGDIGALRATVLEHKRLTAQAWLAHAELGRTCELAVGALESAATGCASDLRRARSVRWLAVGLAFIAGAAVAGASAWAFTD